MSTLAASPPQRYGLGVFLRKGYPVLGHGAWGMGHGDTPVVRGAEVRQISWEELPEELSELVRRRVSADPIVAAQVAASDRMTSLRAPRSGEIVLTNVPGATILLDIAPRATVTLHEEPLESAFRAESRTAAGSAGRDVRTRLWLVRVGAGALLRWYGGSVSALGFTIVERLAVLARDAVLEHHSALVSANAIRENFHVVLNAPGATARVRSLFAGSSTHQFDLGVTAEHRAPRTTSDLRAKGVLGGKAQGVVRGLIRMQKNATGSDGYQRCDALLLSPTAEVDPIPNLEIETNDVRCTHGVTVSHPNAEQLFYLQSRGLSEGAARNLLVEGFVGSMLQPYPVADRERLKSAVGTTLAGTGSADFTVLRNTVK